MRFGILKKLEVVGANATLLTPDYLHALIMRFGILKKLEVVGTNATLLTSNS